MGASKDDDSIAEIFLERAEAYTSGRELLPTSGGVRASSLTV